MPNAGAITYPAWYMDDNIYTTNKIPIPAASVNIIYVNSYEAPNPFSYFLSLDNQIDKQPLEIVDVAGFLNYTAIAVSVTTGTKKMQFQLSGLTGNSTVTLTVPNASTTIVGTDATQTLTNKTFSDTLATFQNTTTNTKKM